MFENLKKVRDNAYAPFSKFRVACIVIMNNNQEFIGVNVENPSSKNGLCAEQVAIGAALSEGYSKSDFKEIHVLGSSVKTYVPCFLCRQLLSEMFDESAKVYCYGNRGKIEEYTIKELCPIPFRVEK